MIENFLNLMREKSHKWRKHRGSQSRGTQKPPPRHIIIKVAKFPDKERILKAAREKQEVTFKGAPIRLLADFSVETLLARRAHSK